MRLLVVSATPKEIAPLVASMKLVQELGPRLGAYEAERHRVDVLVSGVGMTATAYWCGRVLAEERYDAAFNFGTCGSFEPSLPPGTVVEVVSDRFSELGAEDGEGFLAMAELGLLGEDEFPYTQGRLVNPCALPSAVLSSLPSVDGITVNRVHGAERSIHEVRARYRPHTESMEGAAFAYACLAAEVPFSQVRSVSNLVERRNCQAWKMAEAVQALAETTMVLLKSL